MATKRQKLVDGGEYIVKQFFGLKTAVKNPKELAPGQPQDSLNFITGYDTSGKYGDNIQLRLGSTLLCKTRLGAGKINALAVGQDFTGKQFPFFVSGGQVYYYNPSTQDLALVTNGTLTTVEDMSMEFYQDLFGPYMYLSSPNNGMNLISVANKQMSSTGNFGGYFTIRQNFMWMWNYLNTSTKITYQENLLQSNPDQTAPSDSSIGNPQGNTGVQGNGVLKTFSGTLFDFSPFGFAAQIGAPINSVTISSIVINNALGALAVQINTSSPITLSGGQYVCLQGVTNYANFSDLMATVVSVVSSTQFYITFLKAPTLTNGTYNSPLGTVSQIELFEDNNNGGLVSLLNPADTGTINYITGAFTINTQTAVPNGLNIDSIVFTGIPGIVTFNAANSFRQSGGTLEGIGLFAGQIYSFLTVSTWLVSIGTSFSSSSQEQWRGLLGIPYFRASFEVDEGILMLDDTQQQAPKLRVLQVADFSSAVEAQSYSDDMDFSLYSIATALTFRAGNYDLLAMQSSLNGVPKGYNDTCFLRNTISGFFDKLDYRISDMDVYNGSLLSGDTISQNVYVLFSGQDDDGAPINAFWKSGQDNWGFDGLKSFGFFHIDCYIGPSQVLNIYAQFDTGNYVLIGSIYGNGKFVDKNNSVLIGLGIGGLNPVGGAGNGQVYGYHLEQDIPYWSPLFQYISVMFVPGINYSGQTPQPAYGGLQINEWGFKDTRIKSNQALPQNIGR